MSRHLLLSIVLISIAGGSAGGAILRGRVVDRTFRPLPAATISTGDVIVGTTGPDGRFVIEADGEILGVVSRNGFISTTVECRSVCERDVVLDAAAWEEEVTVTATRSPAGLRESTESVRVFNREALTRAPSTAVDDTLRHAAGFSLFRRTSSRFSNPTTQGASARGLGASGASRIVVQVDGVPLNDPFGGWVQWSSVPFLALERAEVLRGGASSLYGSGAIGGVVRLDLEHGPSMSVEARGGSLGTIAAGAHVSHQGEAYVSLDAEHFETDGYIAIDPAVEGSVDRPLASTHDTLLLAAGRNFGPVALRGKVSHFREDRQNGTQLQRNATESTTLSALASFFSSTIRIWSTASDYEQSFTAVSAGRESERLARLQRVPLNSLGISTETALPLKSAHLLFGADVRIVDAVNEETNVFAGSLTRMHAQERTLAAFGRYLHSFDERTSASVTLRADSWSVQNPTETFRLSDREGVVTFDNRNEVRISPAIGVLHDFGRGLTVSLTAHEGFRAPSLNELYRGFRVGNVQTEANPRLLPERSKGGELSVRKLMPRSAVRVQLFQTTIDDSIGNVTLSATSSLIRRRRENAGVIVSRGIEVEGEVRPSDGWQLAASALVADARVKESSVTTLTGNRVPQVPRVMLSAETRNSFELATVILRARYQSSQFDDDRNAFRLGAFTAFDLSIWKQLDRRWSVAILGENLFDAQIEAARTPLLSFGTPRMLHVALRWER